MPPTRSNPHSASSRNAQFRYGIPPSPPTLFSPLECDTFQFLSPLGDQLTPSHHCHYISPSPNSHGLDIYWSQTPCPFLFYYPQHIPPSPPSSPRPSPYKLPLMHTLSPNPIPPSPHVPQHADASPAFTQQTLPDGILSPSLTSQSDSPAPSPPQEQWHTNPDFSLNLNASLYSSRFPKNHMLHPSFVETYQLGDELGVGGYGFVMTARHLQAGHEVAVKFIVKQLVPDHAWIEHPTLGRVPCEIILLSYIKHENIVQCFDVFEDPIYYYLVQELHGSPWREVMRRPPLQNAMDYHQPTTPDSLLSSPLLSPCVSEGSLVEAGLDTPPQHCTQLDPQFHPRETQTTESTTQQVYSPPLDLEELSHTCPFPVPSSRPSHDLFECIEQAPGKRFTETQAQYIFAQVVDAVYYLDNLGITHRDIKDENIVIDKNLKVKLIDFGSAIIVDPEKPRPYYTLFYGTSAYASSEILRKVPYQAPPAEIWTLGILLSYLLTGASPFVSDQDALEGKIVLRDVPGIPRVSAAALHLLKRCLHPDPSMRADIREVKCHFWLRGVMDGFMGLY